jgi:TRAP-type C4-dicarboxylate transport system permease small subunit
VINLLMTLDRWLSGAVRWVVIAMMMVMTGVVFSQVLARYFFNSSLSWSEEIARFAFVWLSFLGAAMLVRRDEHIRVTLLVNALPTPLWAVARALQYAGVLICLYFFVSGGFSLTGAEWAQLAPATQIPMGWVYLIIPVASGLMLLWTLSAIAVDLVQGRPPEPAPEHGATSDVALTQ